MPYMERCMRLGTAGKSLTLLVIACGMIATPAGFAADAGNEPRMPAIIEQFSADRMSLQRTYALDISPVRAERFTKFYADELSQLASLDFDRLSHDDQVDYLLLKNLLVSQQHQLAIQQRQIKEMEPLLPFAAMIENLLDARRKMQTPDGEKDAAALTELVKQIADARKQLDPHAHEESGEASAASHKIDPVVANRAVNSTRQLSAALKDWFDQ